MTTAQHNPVAPPPQRTLRKRLAFYAIALFLLTALPLLILECTVRLFVLRETSLDWLQWHPTRLYVNNPNLSDIYWDTEWNVNSWGLRGPEIGPKNKPRIYCLGYSSTFGYKVAYKDCYPSQLQVPLPQYEVINGGVFGYSSYQGLQLLKETVDWVKPDIVTINFGYNDRRYVVRPEWADGPDSFRDMYRRYRLHTWLSTSRVYQALMQKRFKKQSFYHPPVSALVPRVSTERYRLNLEEMIELCRERNIQVILIALGDHPILLQDAEAGVELLQQGDFENALGLLAKARRGPCEDARVIAAYYTSIALQALGRMEEADQMSDEYSFDYFFPGVYPIRTSHSYFQVLRDLSQEHNLPLLFFRDLIHNDPQYYIDECHPSAEGYRILGQALAETVKGM